jgi:undecaprenyl-diphosphatase
LGITQSVYAKLKINFVDSSGIPEPDVLNPDHAISLFLNSFVGRSSALDEILVRLMSGTSMFSGAMYIAVLWFLWFKNSDARDRVQLLIGVAAAVAAALLSRAIQFSLPFHPRPLYKTALHLKWASQILPGTLSHWSSFPSDHATICFALASVIFLHHRKIGAAAFAWSTALTACRVALGFHYASDVVAGAVLGITAVAISQRIRVSARASAVLARIWERHQAAFCLLLFLMSYELSVFYTDFQTIIQILVH